MDAYASQKLINTLVNVELGRPDFPACHDPSLASWWSFKAKEAHHPLIRTHFLVEQEKESPLDSFVQIELSLRISARDGYMYVSFHIPRLEFQSSHLGKCQLMIPHQAIGSEHSLNQN